MNDERFFLRSIFPKENCGNYSVRYRKKSLAVYRVSLARYVIYSEAHSTSELVWIPLWRFLISEEKSRIKPGKTVLTCSRCVWVACKLSRVKFLSLIDRPDWCASTASYHVNMLPTSDIELWLEKTKVKCSKKVIPNLNTTVGSRYQHRSQVFSCHYLNCLQTIAMIITIKTHFLVSLE